MFSISSKMVSMPIYFLFIIGSAVTFDNLPFCHEVVQISLNLARGEQLLYKLKACRTGGL